MSDSARILEVIRDAARRHDDLALALRGCGIPGAALAATRLEAGSPLSQALVGLLPPRLAAVLDGGSPPLAAVAAMLADEAWRRSERRRLLADHLGYPLASCAMVAAIAVVVRIGLPAGPWYAPLVSGLWALPPALAAVLLVVAPALPRRWHLPGSAWARHLDQAGRYARAALVVRWRLTEDEARRILGFDPAPMAGLLGLPGAEEHCRTLADWHRRAARRRLACTAFAAAALVLVAGGGLVLGSLRLWTGVG